MEGIDYIAELWSEANGGEIPHYWIMKWKLFLDCTYPHYMHWLCSLSMHWLWTTSKQKACNKWMLLLLMTALHRSGLATCKSSTIQRFGCISHIRLDHRAKLGSRQRAYSAPRPKSNNAHPRWKPIYTTRQYSWVLDHFPLVGQYLTRGLPPRRSGPSLNPRLSSRIVCLFSWQRVEQMFFDETGYSRVFPVSSQQTGNTIE